MYAHFLPFFAATFLNITAAQYGLIEGFALGCYHFLRSVAETLAKKISPKITVIIGYLLVILARLGLPLAQGWLFLLPLRGLRQTGQRLAGSTQKDSLARHQTVFTILRTVTTAGMLLGPIVGLFVLTLGTHGQLGINLSEDFSETSFRWLFMWAALPTIFSAWLVWKFFQTPGKATKASTSDVRMDINFHANVQSYVAQKPLFYMTLSYLTLTLGAVPLPMIMFYLYKELNGSIGQGAFLAIVYILTHFLVGRSPTGWLVKRLGHYLTQFIATILCAVALLSVILVSQPLGLIIPLILYGAFEAIWSTVRRDVLTDLIPAQSRDQMQKTFSLFYGLAALLSPIILGICWQVFSAKFAFILAAIISALSIIILNYAQKFSPQNK